MSYHYLVTTRGGEHEFQTMKEAFGYRASFGGVVYIVMGQDRAIIG
jgi:hypothetical protein